jgi:hypothetical protein
MYAAYRPKYDLKMYILNLIIEVPYYKGYVNPYARKCLYTQKNLYKLVRATKN